MLIGFSIITPTFEFLPEDERTLTPAPPPQGEGKREGVGGGGGALEKDIFR